MVTWVVDNDHDLLGFLEAVLVKKFGSEVRCFEDGSAAIAALSEGGPDVLLCDLELPARRVRRSRGRRRDGRSVRSSS